MTTYSLSHLSDDALLHDLATLVSRDRVTTAALSAHIAEVDVRRLYLPAGYSSMHEYCIEKLRLSEDGAYKRITAARKARHFPALFTALADGRLSVSAICLLAPHLVAENAGDLIGAAKGKTRVEIEQLIAERFPRSELLPMATVLGRQPNGQLAPGRVEAAGAPAGQNAGRGPCRKLTPIATERFALQVSMGKSAHDKLCHAQALLGHQIPGGDLAAVLERVLEIAIAQLEKRKFAATDRPRLARGSSNPRTIPAPVQRAVWERDGGRCAFVSSAGHRCSARDRLEFDHVDPVARGGRATVNGVRLLCRAHNQYEAERVFGAPFMRNKREEARQAKQDRRAETEDAAKAMAKERTEEVIPWLQALGIGLRDARQAAGRCESIPDASIEDRVRLALSYFGPRTASRGRAAMI